AAVGGAGTAAVGGAGTAAVGGTGTAAVGGAGTAAVGGAGTAATGGGGGIDMCGSDFVRNKEKGGRTKTVARPHKSSAKKQTGGHLFLRRRCILHVLE
ncbi:hypothetical protein TcCL_ESM03861, partial [Trypanosoma cruzi]